jgi:hypothetical protein
MRILYTLIAAALALYGFAAPANAGYVTFNAYPDVEWTYYAIYFHTGGESHLTVRRGTTQCQSQLEAEDAYSLSKTGVPDGNSPRYSLAPFIKNSCN